MSRFLNDGPDGMYRHANETLELSLTVLLIILVLVLGASMWIFR